MEKRLSFKGNVLPPFILCPKCSNESYGVVRVWDDAVQRKCTNCSQDEVINLNKLNKKFIYLDQWLISNISKSKDDPNLKIYRRLEILLTKCRDLQLIIIPKSQTHLFESIGTKKKELTRTLEELSNGCSLEYANIVKNHQLLESLKVKFPGSLCIVDAFYDITSGQKYSWSNREHYDIALTFGNELDEVLREKTEQSSKAQIYVFNFLKQESCSKREFFKDYLDCIKLEISQGEMLLTAMNFLKTENSGDFFQDYINNFKLGEIPFYDIYSRLLYELYCDYSSGDGSKKSIESSILNDLFTVSMILPYVDVLTVDSYFYEILNRSKILNEYENVKVFIPKAKSLEELILLLEKLIESAPESHLKLVRSIYCVT